MDSNGKITMYVFLAGGTIVTYLWLLRQKNHAHNLILSPRRGVLVEQVYPKNKTERDKTDTDIDIIAIHGLDTKSPDTWTWNDPSNREKSVNWLQNPEMLPSKLKRVRIFTCDWPADLLQQPDLIQKTVEELALLLIDGIQRRDPVVSDHARREDRPILFIASCLGGIILMKALVDAEGKDSEVRRATRGIVFLATPFRGTSFQDVAAWAEPGLAAWASIRGQEVNKLLASMKGSTLDLEALVRNFDHLFRHKDPPCQVFNFYELGKTSLPHKLFPWLPIWFHQEKQLVNSSSATLDMVKSPLPLERPHVLMNKFGSRECPDYERVAGKIQDILGKIREGSLLEQADAWIRDKHYTEDRLKIERLSGDPLLMKQCYINLAIVEERGRNADRSREGSRKDTAPHSSPFSLRARLKVETPDKTIQVELQTLFNPRKHSDGQTTEPRRILIRGRAGIGKTTLCKKMVYEFAHRSEEFNKWSELFDRVLWVPLRRLKDWSPNLYDLEELFSHEYFAQHLNRTNLAKELRHIVEATHGGRILFILDGLDEVSQELSRDDYKADFLRHLLNQPNVIITSRPYASLPVRVHPPDLELETIGFYPDQVKEYLQKTTFTDPRRVDEVQSFLQQHQLIQDLVRIPIQLDAFCYTWDSFGGKTMPQTMTAVYETIVEHLWKKDVLRLDKQHEGTPVAPSDIRDVEMDQIENLVNGEVYLLQGLAFTGLCNDVIDFESKHRSVIYRQFRLPGTNIILDKTLPRLSFLRTSDTSTKDHNRNYHFLHLTFQEYFAARYFVRQWRARQPLKCLQFRIGKDDEVVEIELASFLQRHKYNARYDIFWRFVAGLLGAEGGETLRFFQTIEDEPRDLLGPVHQRLVMHCLSEIAPPQEKSEFSQLREHLEGQLKQWLLFECNFEFNYTGRSQLAIEIEFPEKILKDILQKESEDIKGKILNSLIARPRLSPAITKLVASYLGDDVSIKLKTVTLEALGKQSALPEEIVQAVAALLKDADVDVRSTAADALRGQSALPGEIVQAVAALLKDTDARVRWAAADALGRQSALPGEIVQAVVALLKDTDAHVRWAAADALGRQSALPGEIVQAVAALLKDTDARVRSAAASALGRQSALPGEIVQAVAALLKDTDAHVRSAAASALGRQSALPGEIVQAVVALLKDTDARVRSAAAFALGGQSALPGEIVQAVVALLKDTDAHVRSAAAYALGRQSALPGEIVQAVVALLKDTDARVRSAAAFALGGQSALPGEIVQAVVALLKDTDAHVRWAAADALGRQSALPGEIVQAVVALLKDTDARVRSAAAFALGGQSALPGEIVQAVVALLKDTNNTVRSAAACALSRQWALSDERFNNFLLDLDSQLFNNVYCHWLSRSFSDNLTWYVKGANYSINLPEGDRNVPWCSQLESAVQESQAFLKVPLKEF